MCEQEQITQAPRGQAFTIMGPSSRSTFRVSTPKSMAAMFEKRGYVSHYFSSPQGQAVWEEIVAESRQERAEKGFLPAPGEEEQEELSETAGSGFVFEELNEDEFPSDSGSFLMDEEEEESFVFGEERSAGRKALPTLPPDAPSFREDAPVQETLLGGIRDLVDAVKGLRLDLSPAAGPGEPLAPSPPEREQNEQLRELYRTIEDLRRQNEELQASLERAEAAAMAPEGPEEAPEAAPEKDDWAPEFDEPSADDPWSLAWDALAKEPASAWEAEEFLPEQTEDVWDLEPVPPREDEMEEQRRREAEAEEILARSARLISGMSILERMTASGETVMEITLDELIAQIAAESRV